MTATRDTFFKPGKVSAQDKAATTDTVARAIIDQEADARERKTEALRALRMERESVEAENAPAPKKRAARASGIRRGRC